MSGAMYELGQLRCPILRIWMWFFDTVFYHAPTNQWKACSPPFFFGSFERYDRYNDPKKYKSDQNLSEKHGGGRLSVLFAHAVDTRG